MIKKAKFFLFSEESKFQKIADKRVGFGYAIFGFIVYIVLYAKNPERREHQTAYSRYTA